ncbi:outer membrane beta-barrel protein [Helicobacter suis]|uniref:OMP1238 n=1 Tax=Helicobacter suis TaxID=104628 RepID=A0A1M4NIV1_9HELI|nr:outer membrane beta-barrel protein [Helicobacter suis]SFZ72237.1 OMP236 [Helicobacter suis]SFZ72323.1 OMP1238 [Helicobacter suis]SFZ72501.1 OMP1262 [Helicobacter suis]SFZ72580.1 OMP999 [Helicobacter suis]BCD46010.1 Outer membrane protein [Helicobacter suis]
MQLSKTLILTGALTLIGNLQAEQSAFFVGAMYEVGGSTFKARVLHDQTPSYADRNAITQGIGVHIGYNQLFGQKGYFGLRYYGFYNWGLTNFGKIVYNNASYFGRNTFNLSGYGVGIDLLINLFNGERSNFGVFGGVAVGGNTWSAVNGSNATQFQWMFNTGVRLVVARHSAFELGVKIPMRVTHMYTPVMENTYLSLKRDWAFTAAYYFLF